MGRIIGIGIFVLTLWAGAEISTQGLHGAFGGALSFLAADGPDADRRTTPQRAGDAVTDAYRESDERRDRMLGQVDP